MEREVEMSEWQDDAARVDLSGVEVHSVYGVEQTLQILEDIKQAGARAAEVAAARGGAPASEETGTPNVQKGADRVFSKTEFEQLVLRVEQNVAKPVLRKLFLCKHTCNMMQEIWIQDKSNPDAKRDPEKPRKKWDPLKEYAIVHLHYHDNVSRAEERHTELVDAVNVRHLAATPGKYYQQDNPFFDTSIEPSGGNTLKVYPDKEWRCLAESCGASNPPSKAVCQECKQGARPCVAWDWKKGPSLGNDGIYKILAEAGKTELWLGGVGSGAGPIQKSVKRSGDGGTTGDDSGGGGFRLGDLLERYTQRFKGVDESVGAHGGSTAAGGAVQPGASLLSAEGAGAEFYEAGDGGHAPPRHVGDQLVQGEWIEDERDGRSGKAGEQQVDVVERLGDVSASLKMVWRDEVKAALELMRDTDDAYAWPSAAGNGGEGDGEAARRELKFTEWKKFCGDVHGKRMVPTCVIDFPYTDGTSLQDPLLERMYCFKGVDEDRRVVLHVHTVIPWCNRDADPKKRAIKVTSVNVRHAEGKGGVFKQEKGDVSMGVLPVEDKLKKSWKTLLKEGKGARLEWQWGTAKSMPVDEKNNLSATVSAYDEVREIIKLGESLLDTEAPAETYSPSETEKKIRGGGFEVVGMAMPVGEVQSGEQLGAEADMVERLVAGPSLGVERPDPPPSPFTVLFVGANVEKQLPLDLEGEMERMKTAFHVHFGAVNWKDFAFFEHDCQARATSMMEQIMGGEPTVLHIACHGEPERVHLKGGPLDSTKLAVSILAVNNELGARRIRLVIANACMSGELARKLSEGIDFVIHHGKVSVGDDNAVMFSSTLYRGLGRGLSLWASFNAARLSSDPYELLFPRCDPKQFFFPGPEMASTVAGVGGDARAGGGAGHVAAGLSRSKESEKASADLAANEEAHWLELVKYLAQHGLYGIQERLRDDRRLGVRTVFQLGDLGESDLAVIEWLSVVDRRTLVRICKEQAAKRMSGADTDDARSDVSGADTIEALSDSFFSSDDESDCKGSVLAVRHEGNLEDLAGHMQQLAIVFKASEVDYFFLLVEFMQGATFPDPECERQWRDLTDDADGWFLYEVEIRDCFDRMVVDARFRHPWLDGASFSSRTCSPHIFILDLMVRRLDPNAAGRWDESVVRGDPRGFLKRTNEFLRVGMDGIMRGEGVATQSYCVFLHMSKLTAVFFVAHLEARRRRADAVPCTTLDLGGFRLFVSSDRRVRPFGVSPHDIPSRRSLGVIQRGLRCLARLPREDLGDALVPMAQLAQDGVALTGWRSQLVVDQLPAPSVPAAAVSGGRRALILAAEKYTCPALQGLVNVDNDANRLKQTLQMLGWFADVERNGFLEDMKRSIEGFAASVAGSGDACLLAFIGHGIEVGGNIFLVPSDAVLSGSRVEESDWARFIRFANVQAMFATHRGGAPLDSEATVFLLDCCHSGLSVDAQAQGALIEPGRTKVPNSVVIFSTSSGDTAGDGRVGEGRPFMNIFTEELLQNPGRDVIHVTMSTRRRLRESSKLCQLAQDEVELTLPLVINQLAAGSVAVASWGGASRPARIAAACTFRVYKEDLASSQVREEEMGKLRRWVENDADEAPGRMLVCGLGGAGKTTLARMFAARAAAEGLREAVIFLSMSDGNCSEEYVELAKKLEGVANVEAVRKMSEEKLRAHVHGLLDSDTWKGRWLVVLDDLPDPDGEMASWVGGEFPFGSGKTLVTSRWPDWAREGGEEKCGLVTLQGMTEAEACGWVRRRVEAWVGDEAGVLELVRKLDCFPLAIEQAAAFAREYSIETPALYLAEQAKSSSKLQATWEKRRKRGGEHAFSFAEVISLTFQRLIEADDDDSVSRLFLC
ncbi:hypothetical protein T484DRAFT_3418618 [Baffinella frigidus]|nr:hypothetical protein T484DRAFT_3418618 [Cryptophyta sp. CCMP2293]